MNTLTTIANQELRKSLKGQDLIKLSEANAASMVFDKDGDINADVFKALTANGVYTGVTLASSLTFNFGGETYTVEPYFNLTEDDALTLLQVSQSSIEHSLIETHAKQDDEEYFPGATKIEVLDVCVPDVIGEYDVPEDTVEWPWIEKNACYSHRNNGVWEFVLNLSHFDTASIPVSLTPVINEAKKQVCSYILFHQGT
jgi:hypothetical protein